MLCQNCKVNNATNHIHSVVNGVVSDKYLCSKCAALLQSNQFSDDSIFSMLSSFLNDGVEAKVKSQTAKRCECCNMSFAEISKTGRVGCGNCYKTFGKELMPTLVRIHGRSTHVGKGVQTVDVITDKAPNSQETAENKVDTLKKELQKAIETEEYERAAELRDEIRRAEGK